MSKKDITAPVIGKMYKLFARLELLREPGDRGTAPITGHLNYHDNCMVVEIDQSQFNFPDKVIWVKFLSAASVGWCVFWAEGSWHAAAADGSWTFDAFFEELVEEK